MILAALAGLGLNFVKDLITDNGEDLVKEGIKKVTGIDLDKKKELTPAEVALIQDAEFKLKELDYKELELAQSNTNNARGMNVEIQTSEAASSLAKNAAYYIDFAIVGATIAVGFSLFFFDIPTANKELAYTLFGSLMTMSNTVINFHRGSSQGSKNKDKEGK